MLSLKGHLKTCLEELKVLLDKRPDRKKDIAEDLDFEPLSVSPEFQRLIAPHSWRPAAIGKRALVPRIRLLRSCQLASAVRGGTITRCQSS